MRIAPACACALAVVLSGVAHGLFTDRWHTATAMRDVQPRLDQLPSKIGTWTAKDEPLSADVLDKGAIQAHLSRRYRDSMTGQTVQVLVVAGRPQPISVHTPDICFQGAGFEMVSAPETLGVGDTGAKLWTATFAKRNAPVPESLLVSWCWNGGSGWEAPDHRSARVRYAFRPVLYKLYLVTEPPPTRTPSAGSDVLEAFAAQLLPELDRALADKP
ncbi:MAG TPA: exosortase-associated EpsI family protein [Fimbriiglobus sp.]|nr:exosortase-associated EpsI family protein [Fimbriiglobus sp.]